MNLDLSYQAAEEVMRKNASSFYAAFKKIEHAKFLDIAAIYAFCRYADDLADTELQSEARRLQLLNLLEEDVKSLYMGSNQSDNYKKYAKIDKVRSQVDINIEEYIKLQYDYLKKTK